MMLALQGQAAGMETGGERPALPGATLYVGTNAEFPPMEYISGTEIVGLDIDLMDALALEMEVTVVYTNVAWTEVFSGLIEGRYDAAISTLTVTPERQEIVDFSLPYLETDGMPIAIAVQEGDEALRQQLNAALEAVREGGVLDEMAAAVADEWPLSGVAVPDWHRVFLPVVVRGGGQ
jgi:ABC-type amino acid transport substrate-binding protein